MSNAVSWDDQRIFLAVLEEGSLSGAGRRLGLSHPTVRSRLEGLEAALGTSLFTRSVRGLTPTDLAETLREPARAMAVSSDVFIRQASAPIGEIAGTVRLSVSDFMGVEMLPGILSEVRARHPDIQIELSLANTPADVLGQEVDIAVRSFFPKQEALIVRKVAAVQTGLFASPAYLEARGVPATLEDLAQHDLIGPDRSLADLAIADSLGPIFARSRFAIRTDSHPAQLALARAGAGIAVSQVPLSAGDPRVARVLPDLVVGMLETWIVTHENLARVPRVRAVFDGLVRGFVSMKPKGASVPRWRP